MKKNLVLLFVLCIMLCGCNANDKNETNSNDNLSFAEWSIENSNFGQTEIKKINCPEITKDSKMSGSSEIFVTDNNIYMYNVDKLFSNDKNCKLVGKIDGTNAVAVNRDNAIDENGILYNTFWQKVDDPDYDGDYAKDTLHTGWKDYFKRFDINKSMLSGSLTNVGFTDFELITLTDDGLYAYNIDFINYNREYPNGKEFSYKINTDSINSEKIVKIYGSIIKTDKAFYIIDSKKINKEECDKYADVKCDYEYYLKKEDTLTKYYDEIMNVTSNYFITYNYELINMADMYYEP